MILQLTKHKTGEGGFCEVDATDILYLEPLKTEDRVVIHAIDGEYYMPGTLKYWHIALTSSGLQFDFVDRNSLAYIPNIARIDKKLRTVHFNRSTKYCTASVGNLSIFDNK
ncbi:LytTR family transcriptional regulator DNA-binding domain-containing protein [Cohnella sp. 56]|uniref:LytTR family transcriptional regulator DNA-binding domain-containing protein n=1 Tax=Cohnella sp. 56 TaxID=3113722 RepID=UPI00404015D1